MEKRLRVLLFAGAVLFVGLVVAGYWFKWSWTGFSGQNSSTKTLWDWLQLLGVLAIPAVIGIGAWVFTTKQVQAREAEHIDNQREEALQDYIDEMLKLLLVNDLRHASDDDEVRKIARVRTLTVLRRLDPDRKASVLHFLQEADLVNKDTCLVELEGVDLSEARLNGIRLDGVNLHEANLSGANLNGASLCGTNLSGARLSGAYLNDADLSKADLSEADLSEANLGWGILGGPAGSRILLGPSNLSEANLHRAKLNDANLRGTNLRGADLSGVHPSGVNLSGANLSNANLSNVDLSDVDLSAVNLSNANLSNAKLSRANLPGADLSGANLSGVDLSGAKGITDEQLGKAKTLEGAIMPDGSEHL
jgi:uncharacterized protein YjbI with pentapeptide repeats